MNADQNELADMLRYTRPAYGKSEKLFIKTFLEPLDVAVDSKGNCHKTIGEKPPILWSSHTDTVHHVDGMQNVYVRDGTAISNGTCLGADCTTGVFIMMHMIRMDVPGHYIFHAAEESGCIGSKWLSEYHKDSIKGFKAAVAFDRKGTEDIITYQMSSRCCSDDFATSLAKQLNGEYTTPFNDRRSLKYKPDENGVFTDTASYTDLIGECTNISVGYYNQHTAKERQDVDFACLLAERMCLIDQSALIYKRRPGERERYNYDYKTYYPRHRANVPRLVTPKSIYSICRDNPYAISQYFERAGLTLEDVQMIADNNRYIHEVHDEYLDHGKEWMP